jgi:plastocyanin
MHRSFVPAVVAAALALLAGCREDPKPSGAPPAGTSSASAKPAGKLGTASLHGVVRFTGTAPEMKVPARRKQATDVCKEKDLVHDAVVVSDGKLKDVLVRIAPHSLEGRYEPPAPATVDQVDCRYVPRIQGVVAGQEILVKNSDRTLHNVHTFLGSETVFNEASAAGSPPIAKKLPPDGIVRLGCDIHPWMRGFVVVTDHPFFAVSGADGAFRIEKVPAGTYKVEAWHTQYGLKTLEAVVGDGQAVELSIKYDGTEPQPADNRDELKELW